MLTIYNPYHKEKTSFPVTISKNGKWATTEPIKLAKFLCRCGQCSVGLLHFDRPITSPIRVLGESLQYEVPA